MLIYIYIYMYTNIYIYICIYYMFFFTQIFTQKHRETGPVLATKLLFLTNVFVTGRFGFNAHQHPHPADLALTSTMVFGIHIPFSFRTEQAIWCAIRHLLSTKIRVGGRHMRIHKVLHRKFLKVFVKWTSTTTVCPFSRRIQLFASLNF